MTHPSLEPVPLTAVQRLAWAIQQRGTANTDYSGRNWYALEVEVSERLHALGAFSGDLILCSNDVGSYVVTPMDAVFWLRQLETVSA